VHIEIEQIRLVNIVLPEADKMMRDTAVQGNTGKP